MALQGFEQAIWRVGVVNAEARSANELAEARPAFFIALVMTCSGSFVFISIIIRLL
ncbi:hypothetical protein Q8F57_000090 [Paraburkholderia terrae]|uniref:hypothetical protein n=1 Tax=Paraburkholderia terrae TaxID=311230 RepID=UPI003365583F